MDGLSAAASGFAVASLAVQLVGSVREIRRFLQSISDAPEELRRLIDLLEQLELILGHVGVLVRRQRGNSRCAENGILSSVSRAINTCQSRLTMLEGVVQSTKQASAASNRAAKVLGSFNLARKRRDIQGIENQLRDAVNLLNLTLLSNLSFVYSESMGHLHSQASVTNQITNTISHKLALLRRDLAKSSKSACNDTKATSRGCANNQGKSMRSKISKERSMTFRTYTGYFGKLLIRTASQSASLFDNESQSTLETYSTRATSWAFIPAFISWCYEFQSFSTCGLIQRALRIYPLIPNDHAIWRMSTGGDLKGIQSLLSIRQVSPFSVDGYGLTLLHRASVYSRAETCKFLFDLGLTGQEVTVDGYLPRLGPAISLDDVSDLRDIYSLFTSRCDYFDEDDFFAGLFSSPQTEVTLKAFQDIVHDFISHANIDKFDTSPICTAFRMLRQSEPGSHDAWKGLIRKLLNMGPDLQKCPMLDIGTILDQIMDIADSPSESCQVGEEWLAILESSGYDIGEYLRTERAYHYEGLSPRATPHMGKIIAPKYYETRYRYIILSESVPRISWDWYIAPEGHAFEVLHEFRNTGPIYDYPRRDYQYPEEMWNWPFFYPPWHSLPSAMHWRVGTEAMRNSARTSRTVFENRFERRWLKKAEKLSRAQGIGKSPKVPGAWID